MQTTLTIDDDVFDAAERLASERNQTLSEVISELSRQSLPPDMRNVKRRNGVPLLPMRDPTLVTVEFVNRLKDELNI